MKKSFLLILLYFFSYIHAQDLHIYYNVYKDSLWYEMNGKPKTHLQVRKGKQIYFHVIEYNNYIYNSEIATSYHSAQPPGYESENNSFLGFMPSLINGLVPGGSAVLPLMNLPIFGNLLSAVSPSGANTSARGSNEELEEYREKITDLEAKRVEINSMLTELNKRMKADKLLRSDLNFINTICTNPNIAPSLIKAMLNDYFTDALLIQDHQTFQLKDISILSSKMEEMKSIRADIATKSKQYETSLADFKVLHKRLKNSDHGIESLYGLMKEYEQKLPEIENFTKNLSAKLTVDSTANNFDYQNAIQRNFLKYSEIINNNFDIVYNAEASSKFILFNLKIFLRDSNANSTLEANQEKKLYKNIKVKVNTFGGFGMVTSVGVHGAMYSKSPESYYISNNKLGAETKDKYVPFVSSMFNLNYQISSSFSPALSFGIGIPLSNKDVIENLSYLLGPSFVIGKSKNFVINGGFIFTKILRLSRNLHVGDTIDIGSGQIPTKGNFETGYFLGISYSIGN